MVTGVVGITWRSIGSAQLTDATLRPRPSGCRRRCRLAADGASDIPCTAEMTCDYSYVQLDHVTADQQTLGAFVSSAFGAASQYIF